MIKRQKRENGVIIACIYPFLPLFVVIVVAFVGVVATGRGATWLSVTERVVAGLLRLHSLRGTQSVG